MLSGLMKAPDEIKGRPSILDLPVGQGGGVVDAPHPSQAGRALIWAPPPAIVIAAVTPLRIVKRHKYSKTRNHGNESET